MPINTILNFIRNKKISTSIVLILLLSTVAFAQDVYRKRDSLRTDGFRIGAELLWPLYTLSKPDQKQWEVAGDYSYNRHIGVVEVGQQYKRTNPGNNGILEVNGGYFRLGYEYNLLKNGDDVLFVGGRYGQATFVRTAKDLNIGSTYWLNTGGIEVENQTSTCSWLEIVSGIKIRLGWQVYLGLTGRIGYRLYKNAFGDIPPSIVPGYGDTDKALNYNLSYYLSFKIPTREREFVPEKKKR
jgi:hypothetical protein